MFEVKDDVAKAVDALYEVASTLRRGEILGHGKIDATIGVSRVQERGRWQHIVNQCFKRLLRERGIAPKVVVNVGYRLVSKNEQLYELPKWRGLRAARQHRRARNAVDLIQVHTLNVHQQHARAFISDLLRESELAARRSVRVLTNHRPTPFVMPR